MNYQEQKELYLIPKTKEEVINAIEVANKIEGAMKILRCSRKRLINYIREYNLEFPEKWEMLNNQYIRSIVKTAIKKCNNSTNLEEIMYVLGETLPEKVQDVLTTKKVMKVIENIKKKEQKVS